MWLAIYTHLDITYLIGILNQYNSNPGFIYYLLVIQIFCYVSNILDFEIIFEINFSNKLIGYSNSNYASLIDD